MNRGLIVKRLYPLLYLTALRTLWLSTIPYANTPPNALWEIVYFDSLVEENWCELFDRCQTYNASWVIKCIIGNRMHSG